MRNHFIRGGLLAAGALLVLGVAAITGGSSPVAQAQTPECPDETNCLLIAKATNPEESDQDFGFDVSGANEDDFEINDGESELLTTDAGGTIEVTEEETEGWTLLDIDCDDDNTEGLEVDVDEANGTVTADFTGVAEGDFAAVSCTFTNDQDETPTATATTTSTATPTTTSTTVVTVAPAATATRTPVPPVATVAPGGTISPPATGSGGLK